MIVRSAAVNIVKRKKMMAKKMKKKMEKKMKKLKRNREPVMIAKNPVAPKRIRRMKIKWKNFLLSKKKKPMLLAQAMEILAKA